MFQSQEPTLDSQKSGIHADTGDRGGIYRNQSTSKAAFLIAPA